MHINKNKNYKKLTENVCVCDSCICISNSKTAGEAIKRAERLRLLGPRTVFEAVVRLVRSSGAGLPSFETSRLSKLDRRCLRQGIKHTRMSEWCAVFGEKWGLALSRYHYLAGPDVPAWLWAGLLSMGRFDDEVVLIGAFKEVSRVCTEFAVLVGPSPLDYLLDVHTLAGYDTVLNRADVLANARAEFGTAPPPLAPGLSERVMERARSIIRSELKFASTSRGFQKFVNFRDAWATPGATTMDGCLLLETSDGKTLKARGKMATALLYTDQEIVALAKRVKGSRVKPFRKSDERVKTRMVSGFDVDSFIRCSYIDALVTTLEGASSWCPLGYSQRKRLEMRTRLLGALDGKRVACSLDQSAFDMHQRKEWVAACIDEVFRGAEAALRLGGGAEQADEVALLRECEMFGFEHATAGDVPWAVGVPSGHKWTALVDSVLNRAEAELVAEDIGFVVEAASYQGDDAILIGTPGPTGSVDFASGYRRYGLEVNSLKTWVSVESFDYLHEIYRRGEVRAFPARVGGSIVWKKPVLGLSGITSGTTKFRETMATMLKGVRRGLRGCVEVAFGRLKRAFSEWCAVRVSDDVVWQCLTTPLFLGGCGFGMGEGRVALSLAGGGVRTKSYMLPRGVAQRFGGKFCVGSLLSRVAPGLPLRVDPIVMTFSRLKGFSEAPGRYSLTTGKPLRTSFSWDSDAVWIDALRLEAGVRAIKRSEVCGRFRMPDVRLESLSAESALGKIAMFERVRTLFSPTVESEVCNGERLATVADKLNRVWVYACSLYSLYGISGDRDCAVSFSDPPSVVRCFQRVLTRWVSECGDGGVRVKV